MSYQDNLEYDIDDLEEGGRGPRFPTAKMNGQGDKLVGLLIDYDDQAVVYRYRSNPPVQDTNGKGEPKTKDVLTLFIKEGNFQMTTPRQPGETENTLIPGKPGEIVRFHVQGHNRYNPDRDTSWRKAKDKLRRGLRTGDVVTIWFLEGTKIGHGGVPLEVEKKIIGFEVRPPTDAENGLVDQARAARRDLKAGAAPRPAAGSDNSSVLI